MGTCAIRRAERGDSGPLADVFLVAREEAMPWLRRARADDDVRAGFPDALLERYETYVADIDGAVAGFAALADDLIAHLYVHPDHQGRGVGGALLDHTKRLRPDGLRLYVFQRNAGARRFYERRGFRLVDMGDGSDNEEHEPDALYEWRPA